MYCVKAKGVNFIGYSPQNGIKNRVALNLMWDNGWKMTAFIERIGELNQSMNWGLPDLCLSLTLSFVRMPISTVSA